MLNRNGDFEFEFVWEFVGELKHLARLTGNELATRFMIDLVSIILLGVMGSGDHDAAFGLAISHGKRKFRNGAKRRKDKGFDAHLVKNLRGKQSEFAGLKTVIVG